MKLRCKNVAYWGLALTIVVSENFLYLFDMEAGIPVLDLGWLMCFFFVMLYMAMTHNCRTAVQYRFKYFMLFPFIMAATSSLQSYLLYGQPLGLGFRPQRYFLLWALCYFPLRKANVLHHITYEKLEKLIYRIGILELILYIGQYFIGGRMKILHVATGDAYSTLRYYVNTIFLCLLLFICLDKVFQKKKILLNGMLIAGVLFELLVVGKMRMNFLSVGASVAIGVLLWRRGGSLKMLLILAGIAFFLAIMNTEIIQSIFQTLNGTAKIDTLSVREYGRSFYLDVLSKHPLLGGGYVNTQFPAAAKAALVDENVFWVDNGIFGFAFLNGMLGVAWAAGLLCSVYKYAYRLTKCEVYMFFVMPLYWIIGGVNEAHWYFSNFFVVVIFVCLLEMHLDSINSEESQCLHDLKKSQYG